MGWRCYNVRTRLWFLVGRWMEGDGWRQASEPWKCCNSSHTGFVWHFQPYPGDQSIKEKVPVQLWARSAQRSVCCLHAKRLCRGLNGALFAFAHGLNPHVVSVSKCQLFNCAGRPSDARHVFFFFFVLHNRRMPSGRSASTLLSQSHGPIGALTACVATCSKGSRLPGNVSCLTELSCTTSESF